jgi:hypothetical protein
VRHKISWGKTEESNNRIKRSTKTLVLPEPAEAINQQFIAGSDASICGLDASILCIMNMHFKF